jgi:hypothetical protein
LRFLLPLFALLGALTASPAVAYWDYGHATVARIALAEVRPETRRAVLALLRDTPLLETPTCPARTIAAAASWADCIKSLGPRFSYASIWHFQDVEICAPYDLKTPCRDGNCVSAQIERDVKLLKDRTVPRRERVMALLFLIHFMGDLHQPLHGADAHDDGGNKVSASYGAASGRINLHKIWDGYLAERAISTPPAGAAGLLSSVTAADRAAMAAGNVADWSRESWDVARTVTYASVVGDPCAATPRRAVLDNAGITAAIPVVRREVLRGGLRLARLLDEALGR